MSSSTPGRSTAATRAVVTLTTIAWAPTVAAQNASPVLDELVVTASIVATPLRQVGAAVDVLPGAELTLRGYPSLADALRTQPGIAVSNSGGAGKNTVVRIRGEDHYRTLLMIDGVKALDTSTPQVAPSFDSLLATSDLERVEVMRGPQGFIYGADAGGVVNVLTKRGAGDLGSQVGLEYGQYGTRKVDAALFGGGEQGDYYVSVTDFATDGFNARTADTVLHDNDGDDNATLHAKLGWNIGDSVRLQLVARDIDAETEFDGCFDLTFATVHDCRATTEQTTYRISAEQSVGAFSNAFGYSNVDVARDNFSTGISVFATEGSLSRFEYTGSYKQQDSLALVYGMDFQDEQLVSDDGAPSREQDAYYFEYQGAFADGLFVSFGARYDDNDDFGSHTSTRASFAYVQAVDGASSIKYRTSIGTGFRAPSLYEVAYNRGPFASPPAAGLALAEERSRGYDVGVEYEGGTGLHVEVTYFDQDIEDEIYFDLAGFSGYLQSSGQSSSKGVEVMAELPLSERWELLANWTYNDAKNSTNEQRLLRPKNLGNVGVLYRSPDERLALALNYRAARDSIDIGAVALDDYEVLDLSARFALNDTVELFGRVQNAADETYQELRGYNTAERSFYAGIRLRL
jgi:vitamin B12 transporter